MTFIVSGDEEGAWLGLQQDLTFFKRNLEYRCVFVRAPPHPELAMRFQGRLAPGGCFRDTGKAKAQRHFPEAFRIDSPLSLHRAARSRLCDLCDKVAARA